jgi:hypothetical protein
MKIYDNYVNHFTIKMSIKKKNMKNLTKAAMIVLIVSLFTACNVFKKPKEGCPSNGSNVGAEKILSGEKVPKARKFKG